MTKKHYTGKIVIKREQRTVNVMQEQLKTANKIIKKLNERKKVKQT